MAELPTIHPGKRVRSLFGESDTDQAGGARHAAAGTWGHITEPSGDHWVVVFGAGVRVLLTEEELTNPGQYTLAEPESVEQCALALLYGQDVLELTFIDEALMPFTEVLAGDPGRVLEAIAAARGSRRGHPSR